MGASLLAGSPKSASFPNKASFFFYQPSSLGHWHLGDEQLNLSSVPALAGNTSVPLPWDAQLCVLPEGPLVGSQDPASVLTAPVPALPLCLSIRPPY